MNEKLRLKQLDEDLRRTAPILKRMGEPSDTLSPKMLKAFRESLDKHFPPPPLPPEDQLQELILNLIAETPMGVDELVTGLRMKSVRCNEQEVERRLSWVIGNADLEEELATVTVTNGRVCRLTEAARRRVGLSVVEKEKISVVLERSDH